MKLIKVKRTDTDSIWDVTPEYYEEYKSILEYIEEFDSETGKKVPHKNVSGDKVVAEVVHEDVTEEDVATETVAVAEEVSADLYSRKKKK